MKTKSFFVGFALCALFAGCRGTTGVVANAKLTKPSETTQVEPRWQRVKIQPKSDRKITLCQKLNPVWWFGNIDAPSPPEKYRTGERNRLFRWRIRNLGHNLTFYVMGIADKESERVGRYPERVFNPNGGWNVAFSRCGFFWLPFASYQHGNFKFYLGWRDRGNFGFKLNL